MKATRVALVAVALALAPLATGCGEPPPKAAPPREMTAQWQDVFDTTPDVYAVVRPQAIKRDPVYGNFWKTLMRIAQARSEIRGVTSIEAMEGCDEIVIGMRRDESGAEDAAIILRGVPASLDVTKMSDAAGHPMLRLLDAKSKVPEYEWLDRKNVQQNASLFVLPDRTWVGIVGGDARSRARQAFATPFGRPIPKSDPEALATVRFDAGAFLATPRFHRSSALGPLLKRLRSLTLALKPGKAGIVASLQYEDEDAAAISELRLKQLVEELAKAESRRFKLDWLRTAQVSHQNNVVAVQLPIPPRLLEELPNASGADLPF